LKLEAYWVYVYVGNNLSNSNVVGGYNQFQLNSIKKADTTETNAKLQLPIINS